MCLRIRQERTEHKVSGTTLTPPRLERLRPRLVGAAAVALVAGLATAAFVMPSSTQQAPATPEQHAAPVLPSAETSAPASVGQEQASVTPVVIEQTISGDDGVPASSSGVAKTVSGGCSHEL